MQHTNIELSVLIPCYNEREYIVSALNSLLCQDLGEIQFEILVLDGMSDDGSRELVQNLANEKIRLIDNPQKTVPYALNTGIREARGKYIVRADAHAKYPSDYLKTLHKYLNEDKADNIGGVIVSYPGSDGLISKAISNALGSRFGVGISFRTFKGEKDLLVDTVPFGAWKKTLFDEVGYFDTDFVRAQDLEFNVRLKKADKRILCIPTLRIVYYGRTNFSKLVKMCFQYGYWKNLVNYKHKRLSSFRQLFPTLLLLTSTIVVLLSALRLWSRYLTGIPIIIYLTVNIIISILKSLNAKSLKLSPALFLSFILMHYSYGVGYLIGLFDIIILKRKSVIKHSKVTR